MYPPRASSSFLSAACWWPTHTAVRTVLLTLAHPDPHPQNHPEPSPELTVPFTLTLIKVATTVRSMRNNERPGQPHSIATVVAFVAATATAKAVMLAGRWEELRRRGLGSGLDTGLLFAPLRQHFKQGDQHGGTSYQSVSKGAAPEDVEDERAVREPINRKNMSLERAHGGNEMDSMDRATTERAATNQQHQWLSGSTRRGVADGLATLPMMAAVAALGEDVDHDLYEDDEEGELC